MTNEMKHIISPIAVLVLLTATITSAADPKQVNDYDVVVIGGTPAGVAAAIAAARADKTVIIIEQAPVLGGVLSSGVLRLDDKYVESNSGVMEEFRQRVKAYHRNEMADDPLVQTHMKQDPRQVWNIAEGRAWEPHTAARIYAEMVAEHPKITTRFNEVAVDAKMKDDRVTGVVTRERDNKGALGEKYSYTGKVIIDATYEAGPGGICRHPIPHRTRSPLQGRASCRTHLHKLFPQGEGNSARHDPS